MNNKIGKFIFKLRTEKGLSQYQLAEMIPITRQAVSKWERGETIPDSFTLLKLSELFDVSINELLYGERLLDNSVETLEQSTLSIIDDSNKKSKKLKRSFIIFTIIILILLLTFLSYYFINSYNSIKVYTISGSSNSFYTKDGIFITTKQKSYIKLSKLNYNEDIEIKNIKLYVKDNNKQKIILENKDIDNLTLMTSSGYSEKLTGFKTNKIINNSYLEITYNDNQKETIKLKFHKDLVNTKVFFNTNANEIEKIEEETKTEELAKVEEPTKSEEPTKPEEPTIKEVPIKPQPVEKTKKETKPQETIQKEEPKEVEITPELIINKIKEKGVYADGAYVTVKEADNKKIEIYYFVDLNQLMILSNEDFIYDYLFTENKYHCYQTGITDCKESINNFLKENLI